MAQAWYTQGYAVWTGALVALIGVWGAWRGARAWPGALWRRWRGVAYVPGELFATHVWILCGLITAACGGAAVGIEWGLRDFQSFESPRAAGKLEVEASPERVVAVWIDAGGKWSQAWAPACAARLALQGEFVEWSRFGRLAGFRDRHRVTSASLSCGSTESAGSSADGAAAKAGRARWRPVNRTWEILRRWDRFLPILSAGRRESPAIRAADGSWRVFVMPGAYVFSE